MNQLIVPVLTILILIPSYCLSAWFLSPGISEVPFEEKMITDDVYEFKLGDMPCYVSKTEFNRIGVDGPVYESRELYCWTAKDTKVSAAGYCDPPWSVISRRIWHVTIIFYAHRTGSTNESSIVDEFETKIANRCLMIFICNRDWTHFNEKSHFEESNETAWFIACIYEGGMTSSFTE